MAAGAEFHCPLPKTSVPPASQTTPPPCPEALLPRGCISHWAVPGLGLLAPFLSHISWETVPTPQCPFLFCPAPLGHWGFCLRKALQVHPHPELVVWPLGSRKALWPCCCFNPGQGAWTWSVPHPSPGLQKGTQSRKNDPGLWGF